MCIQKTFVEKVQQKHDIDIKLHSYCSNAMFFSVSQAEKGKEKLEMMDIGHLQGEDDQKVSVGGKAWICAEKQGVKGKRTGFWRRKTVEGACP